MLSQLSRRTSARRFLPEIDGLRFVAITLVVFYHIAHYYSKIGAHSYTTGPGHDPLTLVALRGDLGVHLFFLISGFIVALPFAAHYLAGAPPVQLRRYLGRRVTRIEPPYLLSLTLFLGCLIVAEGSRLRDLWPSYVAGLLYLHGAIFGRMNPINSVAWSLEVEIQFYLLMPLLAMLFHLRPKALRRSTIVALGLGAVLLQSKVVDPSPYLALSLAGYLEFFLGGFLLADIYLTDWLGAPSRSVWWDVTALIAWPVLFAIWPHPMLRDAAFPVAGFLVAAAAFRGRYSQRLFSIPWLTTIGGMCYTIYLLHEPLTIAVLQHSYAAFAPRPFAANLLLQCAIVLPLLAIVCLPFFLYVERPCMNSDWLRRLWSDRRPLARLGHKIVHLARSQPAAP